jgi:biopolymer transport protein ExbD
VIVAAMRGVVVVVVAALLAGCLISPPIHFGGGKSPEQAQRDTLAKLMPPQLGGDSGDEATPPPDVRDRRMRVWADDQFRAQNVHWERTFQDELDYANSVLAPLLGIRFVADYQAWSRHAPSATLADSLLALAEQDRGDDVFAVVGLTSSLGLTSATFEQIGLADLPGKHLMLRGYADVEEARMFDTAFPKIDREQREAVHEARRRHKTAALLLHELGHNFGAPHADATDTIMSALYSDHAASFDEQSRALMRATVDARLGRERTSPATATTSAAVRHPTFVLVLLADGAVTLGGQRLDTDTLDDLLRRTFADDATTEVIVKTARGAPRAGAAAVLDHARAAGFSRMSIVVGE